MIDAADVQADAAARELSAEPAEALLRALVVLVDDDEDVASRIGPLVSELVEEGEFHVDATVCVPGDEVEIRNALNTAVIGGVDLVVSVGGVGVRARDVTPEATEPLLDRRLRGIEEALRSSGLAAGAADGGLSRGVAGTSGQTVVVNLAGSRAAIRDGMATLLPLAHYVIDQLREF
ncbi:putative molybdenum cofactor biosynthesis protein [Gordonia hirsuta DSM 44140 = NBRC 16056]|uniref:Putative molybdenum cofactor biosynthesis protein n=1 Tax=Gordonia hirsuta DSM 44140 = NBRC 16056 TaxID=1121927 RepID=L7LBS4_9ACTN|nr:putative molybdenum cofactor biosynthesis protein [Gordonia hirsuta DSM 44140 = NBRC 16056]